MSSVIVRVDQPPTPWRISVRYTEKQPEEIRGLRYTSWTRLANENEYRYSTYRPRSQIVLIFCGTTYPHTAAMSWSLRSFARTRSTASGASTVSASTAMTYGVVVCASARFCAPAFEP